MATKLDLTGKKFNRLTVLQESPQRTNAGKVQWECVCECGGTVTVIGSKLVSGWSKSCGCISLERASNGIGTTHGMTSSSEWKSWRSMKKRCFDPNNISYPHYGGRGIRICDRWIDSFENFYDDLGKMPADGMSLERINPNGDYTPENCRWATYKEQGNNRRSNVLIEFDGSTKTLTQWAEHIGISRHALWARLNKSGWDIGSALTKPLDVGMRRHYASAK